MTLNAGIILSGQTPNILGSMAQGVATGRQAFAGQRDRQLADIYSQHGQGIAAGNAGALNALSQFDPMATLGVQETRLGMDAQRQQMRHADERMGLARAAGLRAAQAHAQTMSAAELQQEQQEMAGLLATVVPTLRAGDLGAVNQQLRTLGLPEVPSLDEAALFVAQTEGALELFNAGQEVLGAGQGPELTTANQTILQRAQMLGLEPGTPEYNQFVLNGGRAPDGLSLNVTPEGGISFNQGAGVTPSSGRGAIPAGFEEFIDPETGERTFRPIQGGPADTSAEDEQRADQRETSANIVLDEIALSRQLIENGSVLSPRTGPIGSALGAALPNTAAGELTNRLQTIRANIGFDRLQQMREASPTGGALGAVSEFENRLLQSVFGSLEQSQSQGVLLYNLERVEALYQRIINEGISSDEARRLYLQEESGTQVDLQDLQGSALPQWGSIADETRQILLQELSDEELQQFPGFTR